MSNWKNKLFFGDNLNVLRDAIPNECVDLIYLDPPFNSKANYNVLFKEKSGEASAAQIIAFEDTWQWNQEAELAYQETVQAGGKLSEILQAFRGFLDTNDMMAYLTMMAPRLAELHRVLKPTGSLYLHCDPTASHYLKLMLDALFGVGNFRTEIIWKRSSAHSDAKQGRKQHGRIHDTIFFYSKTQNWTWHWLYSDYDEEYVNTFYRHKEENTGRLYRLDNLTGPGGAGKGNPEYEVMGITRHWRYSKEKMQQLIKEGRIIQTKPGTVPAYKRYLDEMDGVPLQDIWTDISPLSPQAKEKLGYPTQKPEALLERIIQASSNENDIVLDPFCGCGTAISVAERLNRRWIGVDITHIAIALIRYRLAGSFSDELSSYEVHGTPKDLSSARVLAEHDRYQFEWWALGLVDARPAQDRKKGADKGVDGLIYFFDDISGEAKKIVVQVKSGKVTVSQIRDLVGTVEREKASIGAFISLNEPTQPMLTEATKAGFYTSPLSKRNYAKIQVLTIESILQNQQTLSYPDSVKSTFKPVKAQKKDKQFGLF